MTNRKWCVVLSRCYSVSLVRPVGVLPARYIPSSVSDKTSRGIMGQKGILVYKSRSNDAAAWLTMCILIKLHARNYRPATYGYYSESLAEIESSREQFSLVKHPYGRN